MSDYYTQFTSNRFRVNDVDGLKDWIARLCDDEYGYSDTIEVREMKGDDPLVRLCSSEVGIPMDDAGSSTVFLQELARFLDETSVCILTEVGYDTRSTCNHGYTVALVHPDVAKENMVEIKTSSIEKLAKKAFGLRADIAA